MAKSTPFQNVIKRILGSKIFLFLISFILIALVVNLGRESYRKHELTKEINSLNADIEQLEGRNRQLSNLMEYFKQDSYLEKEARLKLNLKKPGEQVIILSSGLDQPSQDSDQPDNLEAIEDSLSPKEPTANYWKWWEYFFSN
ncbi:MAG: hypothetical protein CMI55_02460 [Parcubacteria group bacterium]|jgi:cell division protein FtsB|nr:hypothetical protein [Parcubacteria group bacterium]|tara:strand:- start:416 stop:844 length:429 start_codon:yes stop_codon:yes gene_type:complete